VAFLPVQWQAVVERSKAVRASLSTGQLVSLVAVFVGVIGLLIGSTWYLNQTDYKVLFGDLSSEEASSIVEQLKSDNVDYQIQDGGRTILVASGAAPELKLKFAGEGLPSSGRIGFEIFDKISFGATEFIEQVNFRRALEGEVGRTISTLAEVRDARVHITLPKSSLFATKEQVAKASVMLTLEGNKSLAPPTVAAITNLVSASVEGLTPDMVVIMDSRGRSLARGRANGDEGALAGLDLEKQQKYERDLSNKVVSLLEPIIGVSRVNATVSVKLHAASIEKTEEVFSPETVLRSEQSTTEGSNATSAQGVSGARGNMPPAVGPNGMPVNNDSSSASGGTTTSERGLTRSSKVSNYEVSKTQTHTIQPRGEVERISVSVAVDDEHISTTAADGTVTTKRKPRDAASMQKLQKLVVSSLGIDTQRGDQITVENMSFEAPVADPVVKPKWYQTVSEQGSGAIRGVAVVVTVALVLLLFVRPVIGRVLTVSSPAEQMVMASPQQLPRSIEDIEGEIEAQLDATPVDGDRRQPVLTRRVSTLAVKEPESAAKLVRGWITEGRS